MKYQQCTKFALCLFLIISPLIVWGEAAQGPGDSDGYVCVPNAAGDGWDCEADVGQTPVISWGKVVPLKDVMGGVEAPAPAGAAAPATDQMARIDAKTGLDANTGLSLDPADWYKPSSPRATQDTHRIDTDLAESLYQIDDSDGICPGSYRQRDYPHAVERSEQEFPIVTLADGLSTQIDVSASLNGNVTIEQGNRLIVTPSAELDYETRIVQFPQGFRMDQPGVVMQGQQATVHLNSKEALMSGAEFVLVDAAIRGEAETINQSAAGDLTMTDNAFTRCEPGNNGWLLSTSSLLIEKDEVFGTAKNAVLRVKSVPVFYSPYLQFPVSDERVSGFLFPNIEYSDEDGVDVSIPYYFNLAPNYDATVIPRYISQRGDGAEVELRHMASWQSTIFSGAFLPQDQLYNGFVDRDDYDEQGGSAIWPTFEPADRWLGAIDHEGRFGPFSTLVDYTSVSDRDYFRDLGSDLGLSSRREIERRGEFRFNQGGLFMRLWAQRFDRLDEVGVEEYQRMPEFDLSYTSPRVGPLGFNLGAKWSEFDRDTDGLNGLAAVTGNRLHVEPRVRLDMSRVWGFLNLSAGYRYTSYDLEQDPNAGGLQLVDDAPDRNIGVANLDGGLIFEREFSWFGEELIQTLEPRVYYLYQEYDEQDGLPSFDASKLTFGYSQLFRDNRFSGLDRIGDADQASVGVTTRYLSRTSGKEYFRFSLGEIFYFDDRRVTLSGNPGIDEMQNNSALAAEMSALLAGNWRLTGNIVWDVEDNQVDEGGVGIQYRRDNRHIFNLGFRNRVDSDIEQTDVSLYWPLTKHLAIMGRWNYDVVSGRTIEGFGGLEYSDCCMKVRLMARRFLDSPSARNFSDIEADDGIFLQVVFKGLAGFGTKVESVLERGVRGYRSPEQRDYLMNR